ncbi:cytochrome c3 family protein [Sphingobacterium oryzagri]|uniref:Cytochrome c3 family protein n=1 Tax=Sphingobacterium oryzagri TaxID=3025669 RepID=A0ABY7WEY5_9SPHI|nr:cytochrome c3 family protein [Sphingobacterium sp. KACC 22765]WDF68182.1 cytochrome c3 family protein [Sphingobacterium sp. KACC 22765]
MRNISSVLGKLAKTMSVSLMLLFAVTMSHAQDVKEGQTLFKSKCTTCHSVTKKVVGPALAGMTERHDEEWLVKWIRNSQAMVASGDPTAVKIFEENNNLVMTAFTDLSDDQIKSIIAYVEDEEAKAAEKPAGGEQGGGAGQSDDANTFMIVGLIAIVVLAVIILVVLNRVIRTLEKVIANNQAAIEAAQARNEEVEENRYAKFAQAFLKNKKLVGFAVLMLVAFLAVLGWNTLWNVGVHQGYEPVQPIKFSHQIHAGVNQIECQYCHGGAFKSKNASIPSANVCMNCHNTVTASDHYDGELSPEIAKIYRALDYDPETREYGNNPKPIQWVRVHNLPDFAYFNHSQHVVVAGVECQTCHGPVETMEEIYQYSPLTMKWCIDCHRTTEVNTDNAYYDQLIEAHEKLKKGEKMTAAMIGGLECGKCHY